MTATDSGNGLFELYRKFFHVLGSRRRLKLVGLCLMTSVSSTLEVVGIFMIFPLIRLLHNSDFIHNTPIVKSVYVFFGFQQERHFVLAFGACVLGVFIFKNIFVTYSHLLQKRFARNGTIELTSQLQELYFRAPYLSLANRNSAELMSNIRNIAPQVYQKVALGLINIVAEGIVVVGIAAALLFIEPLATIVVTIVVGLLFGLQFFAFNAHLKRWREQSFSLSREGQKNLGEALQALKEIRILGRENHFLENLDAVTRREAKLAGNRQFLNETIRPATEIIMLVGIFSVVTIILLSNNPNESLPSLAVFAVAGIRLVPTLNRFFKWIAEVRHGLPAVRKITSELERFEADEIKSDETADKLPFNDAIRLEQVKFHYREHEGSGIQVDRLEIRRGQFVGIIGPSGAGKSTLVDLILGLLQPLDGRITVDGVDLADHAVAWQKNIGYVPQHISYLDDSIRNNVALGIDRDKIDDERVFAVLRAVGLGPGVKRLAEGLDTQLGERGFQLSGGQRQRLGIARAVYHKPDVLIMDEPTSHLDNEIRQAFIEILRKLKGQKTIIMIAHQLSTIQYCDRVILVKDGTILDSGSYEDLKESNEYFQQLLQLEYI